MVEENLDEKLKGMIDRDLNRKKRNILNSYDIILEELREVPLAIKQKERVVFEAAAILGNTILAQYFGDTYRSLEQEYIQLKRLEPSEITPEDRSTTILATAHYLNHAKDKIFTAALRGYQKR